MFYSWTTKLPCGLRYFGSINFLKIGNAPFDDYLITIILV